MQAMAEFPALAGLLVPGGESAGGPDSFPPEIEEEANNNFQVRPAASRLDDPRHSFNMCLITRTTVRMQHVSHTVATVRSCCL